MAKLTLRDFGSDYASKQNLNSNNDAIETALENTLSRDGTGPNAMTANFDMNGNRILNLPTPTNPMDAVRLQDISGIVGVVAPNVVAGQFPTTAGLLSYWDNTYTLTNGMTVITGARSVMKDRGGSIFIYDSTDTTTADNGGTVRVDSANRRWKARVDYVTPELFGAKGDGVTDDTVAIQKTLNWGGHIVFGAYSYKYTTLTITVPCRLEGALQSALTNGASGTLLLCSSGGAGDKITIGALAYELSAVVIEHLCFSAPSATGGAILFYNWIRDCTVRDVQFLNLNSTATGIKFTQANTLRVYDTRIISPTTYGIYGYGNDTHRSDEIDLVNIIISGDSTGAGTHVPDAITLDGFVNTVTGHHINIVDCGRGLYCKNTVGATSRGEYVFFHDFEVDYPKYEGVRLEYHDGVFISNVYIHGSLLGNGVSVVHNGTQTTSNISFIGGQITSSALYGMVLNGRNTRVVGMEITGNGVSFGNNGINIGANSIGTIVTGCIIGPMTGFYAEHQSYGVEINSGAKEYNVSGNHLKGNLLGPVFDANATAGGDIVASYDSTIWNNTGMFTDQSLSANAASSGDTINMNATQHLHIVGAGPLATLTINFPSPAYQGQVAEIWSQPAITALTIVAGSGQTIDAGSVVTALTAASGVRYKYNQANQEWYRFG